MDGLTTFTLLQHLSTFVCLHPCCNSETMVRALCAYSSPLPVRVSRPQITSVSTSGISVLTAFAAKGDLWQCKIGFYPAVLVIIGIFKKILKKWPFFAAHPPLNRTGGGLLKGGVPPFEQGGAAPSWPRNFGVNEIHRVPGTTSDG